jgi:hypothetical protein
VANCQMIRCLWSGRMITITISRYVEISREDRTMLHEAQAQYLPYQTFRITSICLTT